MVETEQSILLLRVALGDDVFNQMVRTLHADPRVLDAHIVDIVVRKDAVEKRFEAEWVKHIARIVRNVTPVPR